tara:strand:- start:1112 stop:1993 length:882 start_codon:yes stop_codon:yes gene_type:complete
MDSKKFSIIIPAYSEEENIPNLLNQIGKAFSDESSFEVIIVDDGSPVSLKGLLKNKNYSFETTVITNQYNLGQSKSIEVGLKNSAGEVIGLIDADCQNPPEELKKLYDFYNSNNFDAVISYRKNRKDESLRKIISKLANLILKIFTKSKFKDLGSSLKVIKRTCLESITFKGDMHRFISPMLQARGYSISELEVEHVKRIKGESKYGFGRIIPVIVDGILFYLTQGFTRPAKYAIGKLSFSLFIISIFLNLIVIYQKVINSIFVHRNPIFIISMVFLLLSIQIFSQIIKIDES